MGTILPCLVLIQPWAYACIHLGKDAENRGRAFKHRGPLGIIAGKNTDRDYYDSACSYMRENLGIEVPPFDELDRGGLIGAVDLHDVQPPSAWPASRWHIRGQHAHMIRNAVALPFRALRGHQGLVKVELTAGEVIDLRRAGLLPEAVEARP